MRRRKSISTGLSLRAKWMARRIRRLRPPSPASVPARLRRWWNIYSLRLSWAGFFAQCGNILFLLALSALSFLFVTHFIFQSVQVQGPSMYPTLINGDFYWLDRLAYEIRKPQSGDIVALRDPSGHGFDVKRIIAIPTDSVYIKGGKVYINGKLLQEPYLPAKMRTFAYADQPDELFCLARDQFFVMGDNRGNSCDSRSFGAIPRELILGKVLR
ncbi:MAG TPA: signal peptidase I [Alphaproteobacteria bacterium]|nr:signal peptidase I [Alphaproteobacteria bacterium]